MMKVLSFFRSSLRYAKKLSSSKHQSPSFSSWQVSRNTFIALPHSTTRRFATECKRRNENHHENIPPKKMVRNHLDYIKVRPLCQDFCRRQRKLFFVLVKIGNDHGMNVTNGTLVTVQSHTHVAATIAAVRERPLSLLFVGRSILKIHSNSLKFVHSNTSNLQESTSCDARRRFGWLSSSSHQAGLSQPMPPYASSGVQGWLKL